MAERDWDAELKKIDKELERATPPAPVPTKGLAAPALPAASLPGATGAAGTTNLGVFGRLSLSVALGVGIILWPYAARCGLGLAAYLGAVTAIIVSGAWSATWTYRHRAARGHILSLLLVLWGLVLGAIEVLPRTGYAIPTESHPAAWGCQ